MVQGLGWRITRVWTMDWWDNSSKEIERLMKEIHAAEQDKASPQDSNETGSSKPVQTALPEITPQASDNEIKLKGVIQTLPQQREPVKIYRSKQLYTRLTPSLIHTKAGTRKWQGESWRFWNRKPRSAKVS